MQRAKIAFVLLLAAFWSLATVHCRLEAVSGLSFLACEADFSDHSADKHDDKCADDACASIEGALYKQASARVEIPAPPLVLDLFQPTLLSLETPEAQPSSLPSLSVRDHGSASPVTWQFSRRAALPPRAPSSVC